MDSHPDYDIKYRLIQLGFQNLLKLFYLRNESGIISSFFIIIILSLFFKFSIWIILFGHTFVMST